MSGEAIALPVKPGPCILSSYEGGYREGFQDGFSSADLSTAGVVLCGCGMMILLLACFMIARHASRLLSTLCRHLDRFGEIASNTLKALLLPLVVCTALAGCAGEPPGRFEELREIIDRVQLNDKLGVCLDTCHVSDAGYDIAGDLDAVLTEFDRVVGLDRLKALHINDSLNPCGARKDRHARIGEGTLGLETFRRIVNHPALQGLPMVLETPNELPGYAKEIAILREMLPE